MDNASIKGEIVTKFLEVFSDENIPWKNQISNVSTNPCKSIRVLYRYQHTLDKTFVETTM